MTVDFCPGKRFLQIKRGAVAITPDERVYLVRGGRAVELVAIGDALAARDELPPLSLPLSGDAE